MAGGHQGACSRLRNVATLSRLPAAHTAPLGMFTCKPADNIVRRPSDGPPRKFDGAGVALMAGWMLAVCALEAAELQNLVVAQGGRS